MTVYTGTNGNDSIHGTVGSDTFFISRGKDTLDGGAGVNTLDFSNATSGSTINLTAGTVTGYATDTILNFTNVTGSNYGDTITGSAKNDTIIGGAGNDLFYATTGYDEFDGGKGTNTLSFANATIASSIDLSSGKTAGYAYDYVQNFTKVIGSNFGDTITGTASSDSITGGAGNDLIYATSGTDTLNGGGGTNTLSFANANSASTINLGAGTTSGYVHDTIQSFTHFIGSNYGDTITGTAGSDSIVGGASSDLIYATAGNDVLDGGRGSNTLSFANATSGANINLTSGTTSGFVYDTILNFTHIVGSNYGDTITGTVVSNNIVAGAGNDLIYATAGSDTIDGGTGTNTLSFINATTYSTINLTSGTTSGFAYDTIQNITHVIGSNFGDTITGTSGSDSILGGSGNDLIYATLGTDILDGGKGTNGLSFANATTSSVINLTAGTTTGFARDSINNFTKVVASNLGDTITGSAGSDSIVGGAGNDLIYATTGFDTLDGGKGTNTLNFINATSYSTINLLSGTSTGYSHDSLSNFTKVIGSNFGDTITGSVGNDSILGGSGIDYMYATSGNDTIDGGTGTNTLSFINATSASNINLTSGTSTGFAHDTLSNFTKIISSNFGDTITGSNGADSILGGNGNDYIYATAGTDTINGASGINTLSYANIQGSIKTTFIGTTEVVQKSNGGSDSVTNIQKVVGSAGNDSFTLKTDSLSLLTSINGGGGSNTVTISDTATADGHILPDISNMLSNVKTLDLSGLTNAADAWGSTITGSAIYKMLGSYSSLDLTLKNGSQLAKSLNSSIANDGVFTSNTTSQGTTTWSDTKGHTVSLHVTLV